MCFTSFFLGAPAAVITNHTLSTNWVWLEWMVPTDQHFFNYKVSLFILCHAISNTSSPLPRTNSTCLPATDSTNICESYSSSNFSGNITSLASNTTYHFFLIYETTINGMLSLWSEGVAVTTAAGLLW